MTFKRRHNPVLLALLAAGTVSLIGDGVHAQMYDYATGRGVSTRQLQRLNHYQCQGQTVRDIRRILGSPNRIGPGVEVYTIRDSVDYHPKLGIPLNAGRRLSVFYDHTGKTRNWYTYP